MLPRLVRTRCAGLAGKAGLRRAAAGVSVVSAERAGCLPWHHAQRGHRSAHGHHRAGAPSSTGTTTMSHCGGPDHDDVTSSWFGRAGRWYCC